MINRIALGIFAHPDDAEFVCAGTLLTCDAFDFSTKIYF